MSTQNVLGTLTRSRISIVQTNDFMYLHSLLLATQNVSSNLLVIGQPALCKIPDGANGGINLTEGNKLKAADIERAVPFLTRLATPAYQQQLGLMSLKDSAKLYIYWPAADAELTNPAVQAMLHILYERLREFKKASLLITMRPETKLTGYLQDFPVVEFGLGKEEIRAEYSDVYNAGTSKFSTELRAKYTEDEFKGLLHHTLDNTTALHRFIRLPVVSKGLTAFSKDFNGDDLLSEVMKAQAQEIRKIDGLELVEHPTPLSEVGGYDAFKTWIELRKTCLTEEARAFGVKPFKGALIVGPPGSGKSYMAGAIASGFRVPLVLMKIASMKQGLVGSSEANLRKALQAVKNIAPCVVCVDEIDKVFSTTSNTNDGGVMTNMLGELLSFMNDNRGVIFIFTANRVANLPAELVRPGRLDAIFGFDLPSPDERRSILNIHLAKSGFTLSERDLQYAIDETHEYSGAELAAVVEEAVIREYNTTKQKTLSFANLKQALSLIRSQAKTYPQQVAEMREWIRHNATMGSTAPALTTNDVTMMTQSSSGVLSAFDDTL